jgi:hypothetical protein
LRSLAALEPPPSPIAPAYVDVAVKRWQDFTGQQAVLDGDGRSFDNVAAQRAR